MIALLLMLGALGTQRADMRGALGTQRADMRGALGTQRADGNVAAPLAREVTLGELWTRPGQQLGTEVRFTLQFKALVEDWNPYLSRFEPGRWLALEAWPDEVFTWDHAVFEHPVGRLFVRRGGGFEPLARRARPYQRYEARGRVREVFLGEPWIELLELVPLEGEVGEGTILHVTRARDFAHEKQFELALDQYERARSAPLPPHALAALLAEIRATEEARAHALAEDKKSGKAPRTDGAARGE